MTRCRREIPRSGSAIAQVALASLPITRSPSSTCRESIWADRSSLRNNLSRNIPHPLHVAPPVVRRKVELAVDIQSRPFCTTDSLRGAIAGSGDPRRRRSAPRMAELTLPLAAGARSPFRLIRPPLTQTPSPVITTSLPPTVERDAIGGRKLDRLSVHGLRVGDGGDLVMPDRHG